MLTPDMQRRLDEIKTLWNKVELHLKRVERTRLEVVLGAINELRYAGRLLVDALAVIGDPALSEQDKLERLDKIIVEVRNNCVRAHADVTDALVLFFHNNLSAMVEDFSLSLVMLHFPQYGVMVTEIRTVNEFMALSREDRLRRQEIYDEINAKHLPRLEELHKTMEAVAPDLLAEINRQNASRSSDSWFSRSGFYATTIGLVVGLAALAVGVYLAISPAYKWWPFNVP
ncbi:MAG: hypothetical protein AB7O88_02025 [Reyranellaceae bacterium]